VSERLDRGVALFNAGRFADAVKVFESCVAAGEGAAAETFLRHARESLEGERRPRRAAVGRDVSSLLAAAAAGDARRLAGPARRLFAADPYGAFRTMRDLWLSDRASAFARGRSRSPWALFLSAAAAWDAGRDLAALRLLARAARAPETRWARYYAAEILGRRLDLFAEALAEAERARRETPWLWEADFLAAELRWALGTPSGEVLAPLAAASAPAERGPALRAWRGALTMWTGRARESLTDLDAAAAAGNHDAFCWRGGARAQLGDLEGARADLDRVLTADPADHEALVWRGEVLRRLGRRAEARRDLNAALRVSDSAPWALANRALLSLDEERPDEAAADFARLLPPVYEDAPDAVRGGAGLLAHRAPALAPGRLREELEAALSAARGVRRSDAHLNRAWMAEAGAAPPERPAPGESLRPWLAFRGLPVAAPQVPADPTRPARARAALRGRPG
jgi:tetratricopeptide (TPR) repeat protein